MSKFQSTVSTIAALSTIFGVAVAGWKVADMQREYEKQRETIRDLESKLEDTSPEQSTQPVQPSQSQVVQVPAIPSLPVQPQVAPLPAPPAPADVSP